MISMIHVLEHIIDPHKEIEKIAQLLENNGILLIQVPDIHANIFDTIIYDHISHFSKHTLYKLLSKYFKHVFFPEKQLEKEITVLASNQAFLINNQTTALEVLPSLDFEPLNQFLHYADENQDPPVSVFGTSPPISIFCAEAFGDSCIYFIDEDRTKEGKVLLNRKILHPIEFNGDHIVFNPLADHARISISNRHPHLRFTSIKDIGTSCINAIIITIPVW